MSSWSGHIMAAAEWQGPTQEDSYLVISPDGFIQTLLLPGDGDGQNGLN